MKIYNGNIEITKENQEEWQEKLKDCKKITGDVRAYNAGEVSLPVCENVGGDVWAYNAGEVSLPVKYGNKPRPIRDVFKSKGYLFCDNILSKIINKKKLGKVVVWKTRKIGAPKNIIYIAQNRKCYRCNYEWFEKCLTEAQK